MWGRATLRKLQTRRILQAFSRGPIKMKMKYFLQANQLYLIDEIKGVQVVENVSQRINKVQVSVVIRYKKIKNEHGDTILLVRLLKTGSGLDNRLTELGGQLQSLIGGEMLSKSNDINHVEYEILMKKNKEKTVYDLNEVVNYDPQRQIEISDYYSWEYEKQPHLLLGGNSGSGKSYLLFSLIHKMMRETDKANIYICDGKLDELKLIASKNFNLPMVAQNVETIETYVEVVEDKMNERYDSEKREFDPIFLVIDEFAALQLSKSKKEWQAINDKVKSIILKGRACNIHVLIAMQRASSDSIDLSIRDNTSVKIGLGNLSAENFRMVFGESRNQNELVKRSIGEGYVLIDGQDVSLFEAPFIKLD